MKSLSFEITDLKGLHLRRAADLVDVFHCFRNVTVEISCAALPARIFYQNSNIRLSILALLTAGISHGETMIVKIADAAPEQEASIEEMLDTLSFWKKST